MSPPLYLRSTFQTLLHKYADIGVFKLSRSFCTGTLYMRKHVRLGVQGVPGSSEATKTLTKYSEAVLQKDWPLAWAAAPILDAGSEPPAFAWTALRLRSPPVLSTVLAHLRAVSADGGGQAALASWPARGTTAGQAFASVLDFLCAQASTHWRGTVRALVGPQEWHARVAFTIFMPVSIRDKPPFGTFCPCLSGFNELHCRYAQANEIWWSHWML